jgi:hypothetical protein
LAEVRGRRSWVVVALVVLVGALASTSCTPARAGTRCRRGQTWGQDSTYVLQCRRGRWQRVITKAALAHAVVASEARVESASVSLPPASRGPEFQVVEVVGSDGVVDPSAVAAISHELALVDNWFAGQTGGRQPRFGRDGAGNLEVSIVRLPETTAGLASSPTPFARLRQELGAIGLPSPGNALAVYAAFPNPTACGEGITGIAVDWTLTPGCPGPPSVSTPAFPAGATFVMAHELVHAFGAVPSCAPHWDGTGHVNDSPADIVWGGSSFDLAHLTLDVGRDDYYGTGRAGCPDIANSPYWQ